MCRSQERLILSSCHPVKAVLRNSGPSRRRVGQRRPVRMRASPASTAHLRHRLALAYFLVQALAVSTWWAILALRPDARASFALHGAPFAALGAFAPGDLGLVALGSLVVALRGGRGWSRDLAWLVAGAMTYAAAYTATAALARASGPFGALLMLPAEAASLGSAYTLSVAARDEALPQRADA